MAVNVEQLRKAKVLLTQLIQETKCNPIVIRLAWHDSGTYNKNVSEWPKAGGANGSIRFAPEIDHAANAGLTGALNLLAPVKEQVPEVSYADLFQMASALAVEIAGGPKIPMQYGRVDVATPAECPAEGNLPGAAAPFGDNAADAATHLRNIFHRMGLNDQDIVALSGAHTVGRAFKHRSGLGKESTKYTSACPAGVRTMGGSSWTPDWLKFDNSYFKLIAAPPADPDLLVLETDACLFTDPSFQQYAQKYATDEAAFFADYAQSHKRLSELGVKWAAGGPVTID